MSGLNDIKGSVKKCCKKSLGGYCSSCPVLKKIVDNSINKLSLNLQNTEGKSGEATDTNEYYESQEFQNMIESCSS